MPFLENIFNFYVNNVAFLMPILLSIFVLGVSLGIAGLFKDNLIRTTIILVPALVFYGMGFAASPFGQELFFNLSAELLTALAALIILFLYNTLESWAAVLASVAVAALVLLLFINPDSPQSNLFVNLSTGLVGSFLIVGLIRREWDFSPQARDKMLWANIRAAHKAQEQARSELSDYYMLVIGSDEEEVLEKVAFLKSSNIELLHDNPTAYDEQTSLYYRLVNGKIITAVKQEEVVYLSNQEARLRLLAYPDTVKRVYKQMEEVLEISDMKKLDAPDPQLAHIEFKTQSPKVLFSDYIEKQIMLLARNWRHGDKEHLIMATDDLLAWAREMKFVKD